MAVKVLLGYAFNNTGAKRPGFSDTLWYNADPTTLQDKTLNNAVIAMMNARTQLMGDNVIAAMYRLSVPGRKLRSYTVYAAPNGVINPSIQQSPSVSQGGAEIPNGALQLTVATAAGQVRNMYLAGLPDLVFSTGKVIGPTFSPPGLTGYQALYNTWQSILLNGNWGFIPLNILPVGQPAPIAFWQQATFAPFNLQFILPNTGAYQPNVNDTVHVRGVLMGTSGVPRPIGRWKVKSKTAFDANNTAYELDQSSAYQAVLIQIPGTVESVTYGFAPFAAVTNAQQTTHKRGIGPVRPRGRSRPRQRRQPV